MKWIPLLVAAVFIVGVAWAADTDIRQQRVSFVRGATSAVLTGRLKGDATVDYLVRAGAGQTLTVALKRSNGQNYFNINPPGADVSMFIGSGDATGDSSVCVLPDDGDYTVRVYLMRPAARRNESSDYRLTIGVTGSALAPLPASKDALLPGTSFHASGRITCLLSGETKPRECDAFVIRRGFDGTATVEIPQAQAGRRRILFVRGKAVASDSPLSLVATRQGDITTVKLGNDERYEIPDALVTGG
jgi:hypothetical protein